MPATVEQLLDVARRPAGQAHIWALHALWLVASAAGLAYLPHVATSLSLALELLVSPAGESAALQPAAARLANAMVAVLGPEFKLGSAHYQKCKALVSGSATHSAAGAAAGGEQEAAGPGAGAGAAGVPGELESVLFAQQLILFSPKAVPAQKHIPLLQVRQQAARCAAPRLLPPPPRCRASLLPALHSMATGPRPALVAHGPGATTCPSPVPCRRPWQASGPRCGALRPRRCGTWRSAIRPPPCRSRSRWRCSVRWTPRPMRA
jgi:hypothetical protein